MTNDRTGNRHPTDVELAAWIDEPDIGAADLPAHVEGCEQCRARVAELIGTRAALALDPAMPSAAEFAAQLERILATIDAAKHPGGGRVVRRIGWLVPLAAAAAIAAIVLVSRDERPTGSISPAVIASADEAGEQAATEAAEALGDEAIDDALEAALDAAAPLAPPLSIEQSAAIEDEFALLSEDDQSAVLRELETTDFDL
jgi:hypothetical protein